MSKKARNGAGRKGNRNKRAQSALEYLLIYSWAIVLVAVIAAFLYLFIAAPPLVTPSQCNFASGAYCQDLVFGANTVASSVALFLTNTQEYAIAYPQVTANFSSLPSAVGSCSPTLVLSGGAMVCNVLLQQKSNALGSLVSGKVTLSAITCPSSNALSCKNGARQNYIGSFNTHVVPMLSTLPLSVTISVATNTPVANGNPDLVTANVKLLGMPIAGATVTFTQSNAFAVLSPGSATTDSNGNAASYLSSTIPGYTVVYATFGGVGVPANVLVTFITPASVAFQVSQGVCSSLNPGAVAMVIDSQNYACSAFPVTIQYAPSTSHSYSIASQVNGNSTIRYLFSSVGGCGISTQSGTLTTGAAGSNCLVSATYNAQFYLTETSSPPGVATLLPGSYWNSAGNVVTINVVVIGTNTFTSWSGTGTGSYTGTSISNTFVLYNPISEQANLAGSTSSTTSTSSTSTSIAGSQYIYCVGSLSASPYNQVYYAPISSTGVGTWTAGTNYPTGMYYGGCSINNGYIYCVGGNIAPSTTYYAPISSTGFGTWTSGTTSPKPIIESGCSMSGSYIYCLTAGGLSYYASVSSTGFGAWTSTTSYPSSLSGGQVCAINAGWIYCLGSNTDPYNQAYYAPVFAAGGIGTWIPTNSYPPYAFDYEMQGCSISGGYIYCIGYSTCGCTSALSYYAPVSTTGIGVWSFIPNYPISMENAGCTTYNGYIYCVGTVDVSPYTQVYYAAISSTGVGPWTSSNAAAYPIGMIDAYCEIPGTGGGYLGGGGSLVTTISTSTTTSSSTTFLQDIYCVGTEATNNPTGNYLVYYAPVSSTGVGAWASGTNYPTGMDYGGCAINGTYIYCVGGDANPGLCNLAYYAPISSAGVGAWIPTNSYPYSNGLYDAGCSIYMGNIYCVGTGAGTGTVVYYAQVSSTGIGVWTSTTSYPFQFLNAGCSISNGYIYCIGDNGANSQLTYYAPVSSTGVGAWIPTNSYPTQFDDNGCSISGTYIYCIGDTLPSQNGKTYFAPISSTGIGAWTSSTTATEAISNQGCVIDNGYVYCVGSTTSPYTHVFYATVNSMGIGSWSSTNAAAYPIGMQYAYCEIPGTGGGYYGGGGLVYSTTSTTTTIQYSYSEKTCLSTASCSLTIPSGYAGYFFGIGAVSGNYVAPASGSAFTTNLPSTSPYGFNMLTTRTGSYTQYNQTNIGNTITAVGTLTGGTIPINAGLVGIGANVDMGNMLVFNTIKIGTSISMPVNIALPNSFVILIYTSAGGSINTYGTTIPKYGLVADEFGALGLFGGMINIAKNVPPGNYVATLGSTNSGSIGMVVYVFPE